MSAPQVVVVVLNWNGCRDTLDCLASLRRVQSEGVEILVVDNGSTDGSEAAIRAAHPDLPLLQTGANLGFAGGNNAGLRWALEREAAWVLLLNNDTTVAPDFLEHLLRRAREAPRAGVVGASIAYAHRPERLWAYGGGRFHVATGLVRHVQKPVPDARLRTRGDLHFYVTGCTMLLRREMLEEVGLLDESYFHFCEDVDLCLRAERAGWSIAVAPGARVLHKVSATTRVSSPLFLYYNLRSRLSLVRRHGPQGAPSAWSVVRLWLRLWRPAVQSGLAWAGWRALRRAFQDYRRGVTGPAPQGLVGRRPPVAAVLALLGALSLTVPAPALVPGAQARPEASLASEPAFLEAVWPGERGAVPPDLVHLLFRMAEDEELARQVLERAGPQGRRLTHRLLALVSLSPTQGGERIEGLHVIRDDSPPPGERPPTWHDLRRQGLRLLAPLALDPADARDFRLLRAMEDDPLSRSGEHARASVVGARLELWQRWWADRGLSEEYWLDPSLRPDPAPWLQALRAPLDAGGRSVLELLVPLADDPLGRHALVRSLEPDRDGFLVAECMEVVHLYPRGFEERGIPPRRWSPEEGRMVGHSAGELRQVALDILDVVCAHIPSGADEDEVLDDWALWWRGARFQARYWRDPRAVPSLAPWLADLDRPVRAGGPALPEMLRRWYVAGGFRDLLLDQLDAAEAPLVSELVAWLAMDERTAVARGFLRAYRRPPPRPLPGEEGPMVAIPWPSVQAMIREMLRRITGDAGLPEEGVDEEVRNAFWRDWWSAHRDEPRWYREGGPEAVAPRFPMERGTAG